MLIPWRVTHFSSAAWEIPGFVRHRSQEIAEDPSLINSEDARFELLRPDVKIPQKMPQGFKRNNMDIDMNSTRTLVK